MVIEDETSWERTPNFEVDSIELVSPQLFSDEEINHSINENQDMEEKEMTMFNQFV